MSKQQNNGVGKLLLDEQPLVIVPSLAERIGLNEAIVLQQLHYWLRRSSTGWSYQTYEDWKKQFPFWSIPTIKRTIKKLENEGLIESTSEINKYKQDRTKHYRINYEVYNHMISPSDQNDPTNESKRSNVTSDQNDPTITIDYTESKDTENKKYIKSGKPDNSELIDQIVIYLNEKINSRYRSSTFKTKTVISARIKEGFAFEDFKIVIDKKVAEWRGTEWEKYLRPETLFGNKFEGYLNQKSNGAFKNGRMQLARREDYGDYDGKINYLFDDM